MSNVFSLVKHMHRHAKHSTMHMDNETLKEFLKFRTDFIEEEFNELKKAKTPEDIVDALIDIIVVAAGTLDLFEVDGALAMDRVMTANFTKRSGMNSSRPNKFGLPDLIKPKHFVPPDHSGNVGRFVDVF